MQNKLRIAIGLSVVLLFLGFYLGEKEPDTLSFDIKGDTAYVNGGTNSVSYKTMKTFLNDNPDVQHFVLQNMPGTKDSRTNLDVARLIRKRGITTHLESRSYIASGAVDLFLAGAKRTMECGAMIGVHSWSFDGDIGPNDIGRDDQKWAHEKFLTDMGIDPSFYVFTRAAAAPDEIHIMRYPEIERYGLLTEPANCSL